MLPSLTRWTKIFLAAAAVLIVAGGVVLLTTAGGEDEDPTGARIRAYQREGNLDALAQMVADNDVRVAVRAVRAMGGLGAPARPVLIGLLREEKRAPVRAKAAMTLNQVISKGVIDQKDAQRALVEAARSDPAPMVRASAVTTLGNSRAFENLETLIDGLTDSDVGVRRKAYAAIEKILKLSFVYDPDEPPESQTEVIDGIRAFCNNPSNKMLIEGYYKGRFKEVYQKYAR